MSIILYGIPNCNTVKKTMNWLTENQISYQFHNFRKDGITKTLIKDWTQQTNWEQLVNKKSATWRNLEQSEKDGLKNVSAAIDLLYQHPTLIKRPVITQENKIISIGFEEDQLKELKNKSN
ncbi:MAG TPA: Spx/MgsR family RNA polymerase-binding regulatory protein [Edaphocola sp.]|nr:Spx/MgsR family RNA polymerase-binding regulatory protein [Edaphocola sp.]